MKTLFAALLMASTGLIGSFSEPVPLRMDVNHSNIGFAVPIMGGLSEVHGKFSEFEMDLRYDPDEVSASSVKVTIKAESIDTGIEQRDEHLRTADFFDVAKHPDITFQSKRIENRNGSLYLHGDLTMHGVTKTITFPFRITGKSVDEVKGRFVMGFAASLKLNRRDFGINYSHQSVPGFIGDEVTINLNLITRSNPLPGLEKQAAKMEKK